MTNLPQLRKVEALASAVAAMRRLASAGRLAEAVAMSEAVDAHRDGLRAEGLPARVVAAIVAAPTAAALAAYGGCDELVAWAQRVTP